MAACNGDVDGLEAWVDVLMEFFEPEAKAKADAAAGGGNPSQPDRDVEEARERIRAFLKVLSFESSLPSKEHVAAVMIPRYAVPACHALGFSPEAASRLFECVASLVSEASRTTGRTVIQGMIRKTPDTHDVAILDIIAAKTITLERLRTHVKACFVPATSTRPLRPGQPPTPVLVQKLERGGLGPNTIEHARHLRMNWVELELGLGSGLAATDVLGPLAADLLRLASEAEFTIERGEEPYGQQLHEALAQRVRELAQSSESVLFDEDVLWGGLFALTHDCRIWWSDRFTLEGTS